jgi:hypothetical protein
MWALKVCPKCLVRVLNELGYPDLTIRLPSKKPKSLDENVGSPHGATIIDHKIMVNHCISTSNIIATIVSVIVNKHKTHTHFTPNSLRLRGVLASTQWPERYPQG